MRRLLLAFLFFVAGAHSVSAAIIAQWTFETSPPPAATNFATYPNAIAADVGTGNASGVHASAATDWDPFVGNGSATSFAANNWASNDYFQFEISSLGYQDITVAFDQARSGTNVLGTWALAYSTDGSSFSTFSTYTVPIVSWTSGSTHAGSQFSFNLSAISSLDNDSSVYFRLIVGPSAVSSGTSRVDNFTVSGTAINAVPEPTSLTLFGIGAIGFIGAAARRRFVRSVTLCGSGDESLLTQQEETTA